MLQDGMILEEKYKIEGVIGKGGFGLVYRASDLRFNRIWAIKEINFAELDLEECNLSIQDLTNSFITEKEMLARLDHPSIVRITDMLQDGDSIFIVMDYIEGEPLDKVLKEKGAQDQNDVVEWGIQLCDALEYIHTCNPPIVYRDMKPGNIMLRPDGTVKLIDFGIAREYNPNLQTSHSSSETKVFRTQGFSSPEQNQGSYEPRSDIYSLGATLYALVTGRNPAEPPYVIEPIRQIDSSLSAGLEMIINRATQQNPNSRYASCANMMYDLQNYEKVDISYRKKLKRSWHTFVGFVAAAILFAAIGVGCTMGSTAVRTAAYNHWLELASKESQSSEIQSSNQRAVSIDPSRTEAYDALIELYKSDARFSYEEERQLLAVINPNLDTLRANQDSYAALAFSIGKLYWYYFNDDTDEGDSRVSRVRASRRWMNDAAAIESFSQSGLAKVYSQIANFNCDIVSRINEGDDASLYEPYFRSLQELHSIALSEENDVVILESVGLIEDALYAYPRKFRAAGISKQEMNDLLGRSISTALSIRPTTEKLDRIQDLIASMKPVISEAISNAFVDARQTDSRLAGVSTW
ncbi:MAG: serine/threonine protein kinase [Coriobacteriales bacterium]|jgi:serine/threonine-protein kinase|nr:serine/threonine protein kinase [Coriobacteriales bacterium]